VVETKAVSSGSAVGTSVSAHLERKLQDPEFRKEYERLASFEKLARIVITRRAAMGWTQQDLAKKMNTTASAVSRLESGQHLMSPATLRKLAGAFNARAVMGLDFGTEAEPAPELVAL